MAESLVMWAAIIGLYALIFGHGLRWKFKHQEALKGNERLQRELEELKEEAKGCKSE